MDSYDAYKLYLGIKTHFEKGNYDFVQYGGKTRSTKESFLKRNDRKIFYKVSKSHSNLTDLKNYYIANFIQTHKGWVGEFSEKNYSDWKKRIESLSYIFEQNILLLINEICVNKKDYDINNFEHIFECEKGKHPILLKGYLAKRIFPETLIILDDILSYFKEWDKMLSDDIVWPEEKIFLNKYRRFLEFDKTKYKLALHKLVKSNLGDK